ncbi:uncharacterized protein LOC118418687 [Branchiostoma floridae]|nr:uncharacterized protein LOC118418687 [Branchiostoma floridae]
MPVGLRHVLLHMSHDAPLNTRRPDWGPRRRVANTLFRAVWFGSNMTIGAQTRAPGRDTPTYVFPEELRWAVRARFPDDPVHLYDGAVDQQASVYRVDVVDLATTTWPRCRCDGEAGPPAGRPVRRGRGRGTRSGPYSRGQ